MNDSRNSLDICKPFNLGEGEGDGGNLRVIVVRVCEPVFQNLPQSYIWPL